MNSLKQSLTSAVNEFQEASQDVWKELENAGNPVRTKVKTRHTPEMVSVSIDCFVSVDMYIICMCVL